MLLILLCKIFFVVGIFAYVHAIKIGFLFVCILFTNGFEAKLTSALFDYKNDIFAIMRVSHCFSMRICEVRLKMFKFKPTKTNSSLPSQAALDHFDFFYKPIFKNRWHSMRLGLLCEQKMCALMNGLTDHGQSMRHLQDLGAFDLKDLLVQCNKNVQISEENESTGRQPWVMEKVVQRQIRSKVHRGGNSTEAGDGQIMATHEENQNFDAENFDLKSRSSPESLHSFVPSSERVVRSQDDVEISSISQVNQVFAGPPEIDIVPDNDIIYPDMLKIMLFGRNDVTRFPFAPKSVENVPTYYLMDASTIFSIVALNLKYGDHTLDMCMSPGGTSLVMLQTLLLEKLVANDVTLKLRGKRVLTDFVPQSAQEIRDRVKLQYADPSDLQSAEYWRKNHAEVYDKILVNVPCTYDREALQNDEEAADGPNPFGVNLSAEKLRLPARQAQILKTGLECLKVGGSLVYTTRSLSPIQNDSVVDEALTLLEKEHGRGAVGRFVVRDLSPLAEKFCRAGIFRFFPYCRYGELIVPNLCANFGPLYACKFSKIR